MPSTIEELPAGAVLQPVSEGPLGGFEHLLVDGVVIREFAFSARGALAQGMRYAPRTTAQPRSS